ncbi:hypothetical protein LSH36_774g00003 [Paralvinella palmiformis]|uniref:G-protein coupled receptors family 1 profile domain-containing protein n=1 Tax=Paralvinella palmiformis TaxID=53620 RepID=A0AAD9MU70_9ANNE|nr:hypothetical protein LSH36_774g00003 [Paralvinella palmiformis]
MVDAANATEPTALEALMYSANGSILRWLVFYLYPILSVWIVIANCLTLFTYAKFKRLQKKRNVMLISLSAVDLFTGLTQMMPKLIARLLGVDNSFTVCMAASALQIAPAWASIFHLGSIAIERHIAITKPLLYHVIVTPTRLAIVVSANVGLAAFFALIPLAWPRNQFSKLCMSIMWYPKVYAYLFIVIPLAAVLILILALYFHIYTIARNQEKEIAVGNSIVNNNSSPQKESRATQVFMLICGIALVCYVPFWTAMLLMLVIPNNNVVVYVYYVTIICLHSNSGMNFLVYTFRNSEFRMRIKMLFGCGNAVQNDLTNSMPE